MDQQPLIETLRELAEPVLADFGMELVDLEFKREGRGWVLRVFIDKPGGVTLDDCAVFSREFGAVLEVEDPIEPRYNLEVSSPGIDRPLKKSSDYRRFAGERIKLRTVRPLDPDERGHQRKTFAGQLLGLEDGAVRLRQLDKRGGEVNIPLAEIEKANLDPEF